MKSILQVLLFGLFCHFATGCRFQKTQRVPLSDATKKVRPVYDNYRDCFFKIFMDEEKNRFNGFTIEWLEGQRSDVENTPFAFSYQKAKFGDGLVYAGLTITFLSYDLVIQKNNQKEYKRTLKMIDRVLDGIIKSDQLTKNGLDGFLYRDIVPAVDGLSVHSDFLAPKKGDKYMSQSQIVGLLIGYAVFNKVIKEQQLKSSEIINMKKKFDEQMSRIADYLLKNSFIIRSEVDNNKKVPRGPNAKIIALKLLQLLNHYSEESYDIKAKHKLFWSIGSRGYNSFYSLRTHSRDYYEKNLDKKIKTSAKTWGPFFHQVLCLFPNASYKDFLKAEPQWKKWVERYRNSMAVAMALATFKVVDEPMKKMLYDDLVSIPTTHMPDDFHADHQGWIHDNRWIRLLNLNTIIPTSKKTVRVYNGLDFLMAYSAVAYFQLQFRDTNE